MAAALTVTPAEVQVGDPVTVVGSGFLPNTKVTVSVPEVGESFQENTQPDGSFSTQSVATEAVGTLTSDATNVTAADTVVVGAVTYTFRAAVTTTANEVKIGADAATSLANLKAAINADAAGSGVTYGSLTVVNPTVGAGALTATTLQLFARSGGTAGNSLASTEASTHLAFGAATLAGGAAAPSLLPLGFTPSGNSPFTVTATDGTNTATASVRVWTE